MFYNLNNPLQREQFKARSAMLSEKSNGIVELTEKKPRRSNQQNAYLHVILGYFAMECGYTLEEVKKEYFKVLVNPDLFIIDKEFKHIGKRKVLRSSADLDSAEMTTAIERFRNWASKEAGIYLPSPQEEEMLSLMEVELSRYKEYL